MFIRFHNHLRSTKLRLLKLKENAVLSLKSPHGEFTIKFVSYCINIVHYVMREQQLITYRLVGMKKLGLPFNCFLTIPEFLVKRGILMW